MAVGAPLGAAQISNVITNLAVNLRTIMQQIANLELAVNGQGTGLAYLTSIGFDNTIAGGPGGNNPGNMTDAAYALSMISYLNTVAQVYYGTVQQGGSGGTGAALFNFNQELSQMWAGQIQ